MKLQKLDLDKGAYEDWIILNYSSLRIVTKFGPVEFTDTDYGLRIRIPEGRIAIEPSVSNEIILTRSEK